MDVSGRKKRRGARKRRGPTGSRGVRWERLRAAMAACRAGCRAQSVHAGVTQRCMGRGGDAKRNTSVAGRRRIVFSPSPARNSARRKKKNAPLPIQPPPSTHHPGSGMTTVVCVCVSGGRKGERARGSGQTTNKKQKTRRSVASSSHPSRFSPPTPFLFNRLKTPQTMRCVAAAKPAVAPATRKAPAPAVVDRRALLSLAATGE